MKLKPLLFSLLAASSAAHAQNLDLRELMSPAAFDEAGLDKLTEQELDSLNQWLIRYTAHEAPLLRQHSQEVRKELQTAASEVVRTQIEGAFAGWSGKTEFLLKNGEVWRQRMPATYQLKRQDPEVEIYQGRLGRYWLRLVETGQAVPVSRVR
jgi:hypothetical protein